MESKFLLSWRQKIHRVDPADREIIHQEISELSSPSRTFYLLVCLSTIIATYGLLANSTAVVIGAMLVAPLMGPIFGIALGLSGGDKQLLKKSVASELLGMLLAIALAVLIGLVPLRSGFSSEIIARTQPTIYDVIIALASGLAGAFAMINKRISPALPGVAISTALVPPLATVGLCLAAGNWAWAGGAFLLFLVNLLAIEFAAAGVFSLAGVVSFSRDDRVLITFLRRFGVSLLVLLIMAGFMTKTLINIIQEQNLSTQLEEVLSSEVKKHSTGARLDDLRFEWKDGQLQVMAIVITPHEFDTRQVAAMEETLQKNVNQHSHLIVRSLLSRDLDQNGQVFLAEADKRLLEENQLLSKISRLLNQEINQLPGARVTDIQNSTRDGHLQVTAVVQAPTPINPTQVADLELSLNQSLKQPVRLMVRSVLTRDADKSRFIYEEDTWQKPLSGPELDFHNRLETAVKNQLYIIEPGARLLEMYYGEKNGALLVLLEIRSPTLLGPEQVRDMETALQEQIDESIRIIARSSLGADSSADYYLGGYDENLARVLQNE